MIVCLLFGIPEPNGLLTSLVTCESTVSLGNPWIWRVRYSGLLSFQLVKFENNSYSRSLRITCRCYIVWPSLHGTGSPWITANSFRKYESMLRLKTTDKDGFISPWRISCLAFLKKIPIVNKRSWNYFDSKWAAL